ncbi:hypothetical protein RD149_22170 [Gordonia westfalica]|uniref:Uncharacterized protein n=1 Tax=Gordonia westfalica TaxID=158898 RepID=A0ABU2GYB9_9ACTN|nr:hypothetical protein [Gordonia westfalica]MDS1116456.1 hypothetical protein [Gordonia westfalica]
MPEVAILWKWRATSTAARTLGAAAEVGLGDQSLLPGIPMMNPTPMMMQEISATANMTQYAGMSVTLLRTMNARSFSGIFEVQIPAGRRAKECGPAGVWSQLPIIDRSDQSAASAFAMTSANSDTSISSETTVLVPL